MAVRLAAADRREVRGVRHGHVPAPARVPALRRGSHRRRAARAPRDALHVHDPGLPPEGALRRPGDGGRLHGLRPRLRRAARPGHGRDAAHRGGPGEAADRDARRARGGPVHDRRRRQRGRGVRVPARSSRGRASDDGRRDRGDRHPPVRPVRGCHRARAGRDRGAPGVERRGRRMGRRAVRGRWQPGRLVAGRQGVEPGRPARHTARAHGAPVRRTCTTAAPPRAARWRWRPR